MGMSILEQLEHCKNIFLKQAHINSNTKENAIYNDNYLDVVNTFNKEVYQYFSFLKSDENILTKCTQKMWYSLFLERKRLEKLGFSKIYNRVHQVENDEELTSIRYKDDGKNTICEIIDKNNSIESFYYVNSKNEKSNVFYGKNMREYLITSSKFKTLKECACINCGAFMKVEKLLDGCDYCGTKYTLQGKVSSLYEKNSNTQSRRGAPIVLVFLSVICFIIPKLIPLGIALIIIAMLYVAVNGQKTTESIIK